MGIFRPAAIFWLVALVGAAVADQRYFVLTYDWNTPSRFEREIELTYDHFRDGSGFGQLEFEYGLTDRWMAAPYVIFEQVNGKLKISGFQLEQRYRLGDFHFRRILPALYFEVHKENHNSYELEAKLIGSYMPNGKWIASGNFIVEQHIQTGAKTEFGYAAGVSRIFPKFNVGVETKGNFLSTEHIGGPEVGFLLGHREKLSVGAMYSFAKGGVSELRFLFEKEF